MLLSVLICTVLGISSGDESFNDSRHPLPVLLLLPYPESRVNSGWDRGLELLPAARVAVREVNNRSDLLPGYKLQLIERRSDGCGRPLASEGINNFVNGVFHRGTNENVTAILGLACSTVTTAISPIAGREEVSLIQIAMANSDSLRDRDKFQHLWRVISAVSVNVNATLSLMEVFNWTRVALIYDGTGVFFRSSADAFRSAVTSNEKYTLLLDQSIDEDPSFIESAINLVQTNGARIIFVSATVPEAKMLMCEAAKRNVIWPGYVWIFHSTASEDLYDPSCDVVNLKQAIENVTLIDLILQSRQENEILVSGVTYKEYLEAYDKELENLYSEFQSYLTDFNFTNNPFANPMYDEVWALALALNASLPELKSRGLYLENHQYNKAEITEIVERYLGDVQFEGAVTKVSFNNLREVPSPVAIYHVRNGESIMIGKYDEATKNLTLQNVSREHIPGDDFVTSYNFINKEVTIVFFTLSGLAIGFTTILVCLMLVLYNSPEVRATSPILSLLIFFGCYLLIFSAPISFIIHSYLLNEDTFSVLCALERWLVHSGYGLILSTILVKLVRVHQIFTRIKKLGRFWKDEFLLLYSIFLSLPPSCVDIVRIAVDPLSYQPITEIRNDVNPPVIFITPLCTGKLGYDLWFEGIVFVYLSLIMICTLIFALRTRKVNYKNFKDTKKIIIFSYILSCGTSIVYGLWFIFSSLNMVNMVSILLGCTGLTVPIVLQSFLFAPKIIPGAYYMVFKKEATFKIPTNIDTNFSTANGRISSLFNRNRVSKQLNLQHASSSEPMHLGTDSSNS